MYVYLDTFAKYYTFMSTKHFKFVNLYLATCPESSGLISLGQPPSVWFIPDVEKNVCSKKMSVCLAFYIRN